MNIGSALASLFFRNRHLLVLSLAIIIVAGLSAATSLPRLEDPRIDNRFVAVFTFVPGASAERVETLVTEPLETSLQEVVAIKSIESTSTAGVSTVTIELKDEVTAATNKQIFSEIRDKVSEAEAQFPPDALEPFIDDKTEPVGFTLINGIRWNSSQPFNLTIMNRVAEELANRLRTTPGTELVRVYGEPAEEITVTVDPGMLADLGMTATMLSQRLALADSKQSAGTFRGARSNINMEVAGELDTVARIESVPLNSASDQSVVRLGDIAEVERGWREPVTEIGLVDGERMVFVASRMGADQRVDQWAEIVNEVVADFDAELGSSIELINVFEQERYTTEQLSNLTSNLIAGAAVVMAVIFIMMGWRLALIVGAALPLVTAMVLFSWQISGNAIHQMSIFGMIIALGLLIDNAIVVADEITQRLSEGLTRLQAVEAAVGHLFLPLLASTLTTALAFAPILLLPGPAGDFVGSIGSSVITAVSSSFILAVTVIAALAGIFARPVSEDKKNPWWVSGIRPQKLSALYRRGMGAAMKRPVAAIAIAVFWPLSGFIVSAQLGSEFFPPVDRDMFHLQLTMPTDSSIENTADQVQEIESVIRQYDATEHVYWMIGGSFPRVYYNLVMDKENAPYYAQAIVTAATPKEAKAMIQPLQAELDDLFPSSQIVIRQFGQGPPISADIEYRLFGPSMEELQDLGERIRLALAEDPDVLNSSMTLSRGEPKLWFRADEDEAALAGLSLNDLAGQLQTNLEGSVGASVIENLESLPVRVRYGNDYRSDLDAISSMQFVTPGRGDWTSLQSLGELELRPELGGITRFDAQRTNRIQAYTRNDALPLDVTNRVLAKLEADGFQLPTGYRLEVGGAAESEGEATGNLMTYVPVLITLTVATLILLFRSGVLATLLGVVATLSIGLGLFATWTMGFPISFNTILGTLGLIGLAFNNSIVVLAAIRADDKAHVGDRDAIVNAVLSTTRHILSTTLTTIGGFLPLLIFVGGDFWPSLSIVLAGGVGGSMILALLLVPAVYALLHRPKTRDSAESDNFYMDGLVGEGA